MLAQIEKPTNDFHALARYLVHGRQNPPHPDRVAWILARNLPSDDPQLAAHYMTATAELSRRCTKACLHTIIAWRADERPSPAIMQEIAVRTLELAGLGDHQALVMGHGDKAHRHLHMMINRVHPETGRAWSMSHDWRRFDSIMRQLSDEYGFVYAPAHAFNPELTDELPKAPNSAASYAGKRGAPTRRMQWSARSARIYTERVSEHLERGATWDDLLMLLAEDGLTVEAKGRGHVVGDARSYVKLSALGLQFSAKGPVRRRPQTQGPKSRWSRPLVDAVDLARGLAALGLVDLSAVRDALREAEAARLARLANAPLIVQLLAGLGRQLSAWTAHTPPQRERLPHTPARTRKGRRPPRVKER